VLVGTEEMGPPPVLAQIRKAGVRVELFSSKAELPAVDENLKHLGHCWAASSRRQRWPATTTAAEGLQDKIKQAQASQKAPGVLLLVGHAGAKPLIAGQGTAGDWLLRQAGARNLADHQGYKNFSVEALAALDPDVVVFSDRALAGEAALQALIKENPALAGSRAVRDKRLLSLDPTLLVGGLGPRLPATLHELAASFYRPPRPASPHEAAGPATHAVHGLALLCLLAVWLSLALGPVSLPLFDTLRAGLRLIGVPIRCGLEQAEMILGQIRLPRTLLGLAVGAVLALSGVAMQGLFRNPLADPGLVGRRRRRDGGGGGHCRRRLVWRHAGVVSRLTCCRCAPFGGLGVTALVYRLGRRDGQTNVATMLLAGIAMTAWGRGRRVVHLPGR
jgi:hypothetical protein